MSGGYTCPVSRASIQRGGGSGTGRQPGGGPAAVCRASAWKTLHGCRPGGVAGSSGGGPGGGRAGLGDSRPQSVLCSSLPPELEPMDWRQLRSSVRQSRGSGSGWGPRARASMPPPFIGRRQLEHPGRWLLILGLSFPICAIGRIVSVLFISSAVVLGLLAVSLTQEAGVAGMPATKLGGFSGPFQARVVMASPRVPSDADSRPNLLSPALAP